uniref:Uncharacterized protein n=1 Tax=Cannabis sativa TaxID=3483 RepID=A0A803PND3_CANSA
MLNEAAFPFSHAPQQYTTSQTTMSNALPSVVVQYPLAPRHTPSLSHISNTSPWPAILPQSPTTSDNATAATNPASVPSVDVLLDLAPASSVAALPNPSGAFTQLLLFLSPLRHMTFHHFIKPVNQQVLLLNPQLQLTRILCQLEPSLALENPRF